MSEENVPEIEPVDAARAVSGGAFLLDVREPDEWAAGHAGNAQHIALGDLAGRVAELPRADRIIVVCRSGARSLAAASALVTAGYDAVNLAGGMQAWERAGLEVVGEDGPGTVI